MGRHLFARSYPPNNRYTWSFEMEDFANAIAYEVKLEIANRYFGFRTRIEIETQGYLERLHNADREITTRIRLDILRMRFLLRHERFFKDFLIVAGLPEGLAVDDFSRQSSTDSGKLFAEMKGEGFTRWRRYRDLTFRVYQSLADNIAVYRETYLDLNEEYEDLCIRINEFHRNNDLPGILSFLRSFDSANSERLKFLHTESFRRPDTDFDQDLRIALPAPVDSVMPMLAAVLPLKQAEKPMAALLKLAFVCHCSSWQETLPF